MATLSKPNWWAGFAAFYGFTNDSGTTIDSGEILSRLNAHLVPAPSQYSNHLNTTEGNDFPPTTRIDLAVLGNNHNFLAAQGGSDYISGRGGDDVLYGDAGADIIHGGAGADLIVGNNENPSSTDRDTVSYLDAVSGVTVILNNAITYVADDGNGSSDFLYGIEDLVGSDFNDRLDGQDNVNNTLSGGLGNDRIDGGGGNDMLIGGAGDDTIYGGAGNDVIVARHGFDRIRTGDGADRIVLDASILDNMIAHRDYIYDFQDGADKLDVSALLHAAGYQGTDPIADGYIVLSVLNGDDIKVMFDSDGAGGASPQYMAVIADMPLASFTSADLVIDAQTILYAPVLGQSNAKGLSTAGADGESGVTRMLGQLNALTDYDKTVSVLREPSGQPVDIAVGGTTVDGNRNISYAADQIWWYPDQNRPGELAIRAVDMMAQQIADLRAQGIVKPVIIWGQGEAETRLLSRAADREGAIERYKDATLAVFDYIKDRLGSDIEFYIMETGRYNVDAAREAGESEAEIRDVLEGVALVRLAQQDMAIARDDVHLAADYADLRMLHDSDPDTYPTDVWHMDYDDREIIGDRLGHFIAYDLGYTQVIRNPGPYPVHALADLTIHPGGSGGGDPSVPGTVNGTSGNDSLVADPGGSIIIGGQGKDSITLGAGVDTVVFGSNLLPDVTLHSDFIRGFQTGPGGDRLDISGLLAAVGYSGDDPIADGYLRLTADGTRTTVLFDSNGPGGAGARYMAKLDGVAPGDFSVTDNLIIQPGSGGGPLISGLEIDGSSSPDLIIGTTAADIIRGLGGNDMIVGAHGSDTLFGGAGSDDFIFDVSVWDEAFESGSDGGSLPAWADIIEDFVTGAGGDRLDISLLLEQAGYTGSDPVGDGYFSVIADGADALARFDADGNGGDAAVTLAKLSGVAASSFSYDDNLAPSSSPLTV